MGARCVGASQCGPDYGWRGTSHPGRRCVNTTMEDLRAMREHAVCASMRSYSGRWLVRTTECNTNQKSVRESSVGPTGRKLRKELTMGLRLHALIDRMMRQVAQSTTSCAGGAYQDHLECRTFPDVRPTASRHSTPRGICRHGIAFHLDSVECGFRSARHPTSTR